MFIGTYQNKIDEKNRMAVPAKFRNQLGGGCVLTKGYDNCLYIYKVEEFEAMAAKLESLPQSDPDFREFISDLFGNTEMCEFDAQGRIKIPQNLREYARISKDLITRGSMNKIEVWSAEVRADFDMPTKMRDADTIAKFKEYGI